MSVLPHPEGEHPIREASISFAVDVSGSTLGPRLAAEREFISRITKRLSPKSQISSLILPWSGRTFDPIGINNIKMLRADGGTRPVMILDNEKYTSALARSSLWFLLTDGEVLDTERVEFAKRVPQTGLHGTSCISVIVHYRQNFPNPASCDISIGVSLYALAPNCLFLFCDVTTKELFILQAKGAFQSLLKDTENPILNNSTTWKALPRLSVDDLAKVVIPAPQRLGSEQIALQNSLVIDVNDILHNNLPPEAVQQIFANEDDMSSVIMTLQSRNQHNVFEAFIRRQAIAFDDPLYQTREDVEGRAASIFLELLESSRVREDHHQLAGLRQSLREAHAKNMRIFLLRSQDDAKKSAQRQVSINLASTRSAVSCINNASSLRCTTSYASDFSDEEEEINIYGNTNKWIDPVGLPFTINHNLDMASAQSTPERATPRGNPAPEMVPRYYAPVAETWKSWIHQVTDPKLLTLLFTPGFRCAEGSFVGKCPICDGKNRTLAWLFRNTTGPEQKATPNFPAPGSFSSIAFPLAMGFFAETDVVSSTICCESCSVSAVASNRAPAESSRIVAALPMVRYSENQESYRKILQQQFISRFADADLTQVFMSALYNAVAHLDESKDNTLFRAAFNWSFEDLIASTNLPIQSLTTFTQVYSPKQPLAIKEAVPAFFSTDTVNPFLMQYPFHGFIVLLQMAKATGVPKAQRELAIFRKFLFILTEELLPSELDAKTIKSLDGPPTKNSFLSQIDPLLWNFEWTNEPTLRKSPKITIPYGRLRDNALLGPTLGLFDSINDANFLHSAGLSWVGPATATFLHALNHVATQGTPYSGAWGLFSSIYFKDQMGLVFLAPQDMTEQHARQIIASFS